MTLTNRVITQNQGVMYPFLKGHGDSRYPFYLGLSFLLLLSRECGNEPRDSLKGNHKGFIRVIPKSHSISHSRFPGRQVFGGLLQGSVFCCCS